MKSFTTHSNRPQHFLSLLLIFVLFPSCKKEIDTPNPSISVFDQMSALIDGKQWIAKCEPNWPGLGCTTVHCQYYEDDRGFEIFGANTLFKIRFHKTGGQGGVIIGPNILPRQHTNFIRTDYYCTPDRSLYYMLDSTFNNVVDILQIDTANNTVEGRFKLRVLNSDCKDTILIENGYFKARYFL